MRADRLLSLLMLLQSRGRMTAAELAREMEVSERTIYRDVIALGTSGVPIVTEQGPGGGISLLEQYRTDLTGLTQEEVQALFMLSIPSPLTDLGLDRNLKEALTKLSAALPVRLKDHEQRVRQRIHIDSDGWQSTIEATPHLLGLQRAIWNDHILELEYRATPASRIGLLSAEIEPYGLVAKAGKWYLVGFRVDHMVVTQVGLITQVRMLAKSFVRNNEFDLIQYWQEWCAENQDRRPNFEALVEISADLRPYLQAVMGDTIALEVANESGDKADGWSTFQIQFTSFEEARGRILALGAAAKVIDPLSLRLSVDDYARQIVALYEE